MTNESSKSSSRKQPDRTFPRRRFLQSAAVAGAGLTILPSGVLSGQNAPSNKLNIALIATAGRARAHFGAAKGENVVALCDINDKALASGAKTFPDAKEKFYDWRKCLDVKGLDAIICATTDHTHGFICNWALNRGLHVYCEKPIANTVEEARIVRGKFLANKDKIATQCGTQRHAIPNFDRVKEAIRDGAVGTVRHAHAWGNRQIRRDGHFPGAGDPPPHLKYDLWIGPARWHPYNPKYFGGCLSWNMFWDFGTGQIGDMGSHTIDLAWYAIDGSRPTSAVAHGEEYNPDVTPVDLTSSFKLPANDWRPEIGLTWYQGAHKPNEINGIDVSKIGHGILVVGDKGALSAGFGNHQLHPLGGDSSHYTPRPESERIPPLGNFQMQWVNACKGDLKTSCDFDYSGTAIELMLLGLVAYRAGRPIEYDPETGCVTNDALANDLLSRKYRDGWTLEG